MRFIIIEFYLEPGVTIEVPSKFKGKCSDIINEELSQSGIREVKSDWTNSLNVIPSKKYATFFLGRPTILRKKKDNFYTSFFPFKEITAIKSKDVSGVYIKYLIETICLIYLHEMKRDLDNNIVDQMVNKMLAQSKKSPVVKSNKADDIL